jgi:hypothetical protein
LGEDGVEHLDDETLLKCQARSRFGASPSKSLYKFAYRRRWDIGRGGVYLRRIKIWTLLGISSPWQTI